MPNVMAAQPNMGGASPRNHVLDGGSDPHGNGQVWGEKGRPIVK